MLIRNRSQYYEKEISLQDSIEFSRIPLYGIREINKKEYNYGQFHLPGNQIYVPDRYVPGPSVLSVRFSCVGKGLLDLQNGAEKKG